MQRSAIPGSLVRSDNDMASAANNTLVVLELLSEEIDVVIEDVERDTAVVVIEDNVGSRLVDVALSLSEEAVTDTSEPPGLRHFFRNDFREERCVFRIHRVCVCQ